MRTMGPLFCKEGLQVYFLQNTSCSFFVIPPSFIPSLHMICHSVSINIFYHYNFRSVENF